MLKCSAYNIYTFDDSEYSQLYIYIYIYIYIFGVNEQTN